ncbi:MAG: ABC transporter substrate-binding protein [Xanthobacteraceae bacterium]
MPKATRSKGAAIPLKLHIATGDYDRTRALADGSVRPEGIELRHEALFAADIFKRLLQHGEFDASEMGLTFYLGTLDFDDPPFIAIPVFPVRLFRHSAVFVNRNSGIAAPGDLAGKTVGEMFFYGTDVGVWIKGIFGDEFKVPSASLRYVVGGVDRYEPKWDWLPFRPDSPAHVHVEQLDEGQTLNAKLQSGEIDALISALVPSCFLNRSPGIGRLFDNYETVERDYFARSGIFPIMHTVVIRRAIYRQHPWVARALLEAFRAAKKKAEHIYAAGMPFMNTGITIPWLTAHLEENRRLLGEDPWPYGVAANRKTLDTFLRYHHEQGLSKRRYAVDEIFAPETLAD